MSTGTIDLGPGDLGGGSGSNASVGEVGTTAPTSATEIAGVDASGNLIPISVDSTGKIELSPAGLGFNNLAPGYPTQVTVGEISDVLFPSNPNRVYAHIYNNSLGTIYIQYEADAVVGQGIKIMPNNFFPISGSDLWLGVINAISESSSLLIDILEGEE